MEEQTSVPDFSQVKGVESQGVDLDKFHKEKTVIELVQVRQVKSNYTPQDEDGNNLLQWTLQLSSKVLETIEKDKDEDNIEFRASELFNLIQDEKGSITGFPTGEKSNLGKFLRDLKINPTDLDLNELIEKLKGKEVTIKAYEKEVKNGGKRTYLKFLY